MRQVTWLSSLLNEGIYATMITKNDIFILNRFINLNIYNQSYNNNIQTKL